MQKNTSFSYIIGLMSIVLGLVICIAAGVHLILSLSAAILKHHIYYFNPIRFLGINNFWPKYENSDIATLVTWSILISFYFAFLALYIRRYDPTLITRLNKKISYNKETKRLIYETRNATEIEVIPLTKLITQVYKLKDLLYRADA
jgi:hypothetical protein